MSFEEVLEVIKDYNGEINVSELLNSGIDLDGIEGLYPEDIEELLSEYFIKE